PPQWDQMAASAPERPCAGGPGITNFAEMRNGLDEDLLCRILGVGGVAEHADREVEHGLLNALNQGFERIAVAALGSRDQLRVELNHLPSRISFRHCSSLASVARCASRAPSRALSGAGGVMSTKVYTDRDPPSGVTRE